ncbi:MAG: glycosyltransferase [Gammaproteobacteria bacterium]
MLWFAALILLAWLIAGAELVYGALHTKHLDRYAPAENDADLPAITIVVPARNEAKTLEPAMRSLLALDYPRLTIVAVDDRSEDATGALLEDFTDKRLQVLHVHDLPDGWLGKNHALDQGARQSDSEWLLFTDADIVFAPDTLRRAVTAVKETGVDHLTALPRLTGASIGLKTALPAFAMNFGLSVRPWRAANPKSRASCGVGAFNLIRRSTYLTLGGHTRIAHAPHDDLALGQLIKHAGYRQICMQADSLLSVRWYRTLPEFIHGLEKGSFAYFGYRLAPLVGATLIQAALCLWPVAGLFLLHGNALVLDAAAVATMLLLGIHSAYRLHFSWLFGLVYPLSALIMLIVIWNSALRIRLRGGLEWRGTFYPLK